VIRGNTDRWLGAVRERPSGPFEERILDRLKESLAWTLERLPDRTAASLPELPEKGSVEWDGASLAVVHGSPGSDTRGIEQGEAEAGLAAYLDEVGKAGLAAGHTHRPFVREVGPRLVVNDGSIGLPYDGVARPSWALVTLARGRISAEIRRVEYDLEAVCRDVEAVAMPFGETMITRIRQARM
jgi:predicted phosphodiesterase